MPARRLNRPRTGPSTKSGVRERKDKILNLLAEGYGVTEVCRITRCSRSTYYKHRREDEKFKAECDRILALPEHRQRIADAQAKTVGTTEDDPRRRFVALFIKTRDRNEAANSVGWDALDVEKKLDSTSEEYDEEFATLMAEAEMRHLWRIEDQAKVKALHDSPMTRFILSNNMREKYGKVDRPGEVGNVANIFWFSGEGMDKAREIIGEVIENRPKELSE